jgi:hypothetical protein
MRATRIPRPADLGVAHRHPAPPQRSQRRWPPRRPAAGHRGGSAIVAATRARRSKASRSGRGQRRQPWAPVARATWAAARPAARRVPADSRATWRVISVARSLARTRPSGAGCPPDRGGDRCDARHRALPSDPGADVPVDSGQCGPGRAKGSGWWCTSRPGPGRSRAWSAGRRRRAMTASPGGAAPGHRPVHALDRGRCAARGVSGAWREADPRPLGGPGAQFAVLFEGWPLTCCGNARSRTRSGSCGSRETRPGASRLGPSAAGWPGAGRRSWPIWSGREGDRRAASVPDRGGRLEGNRVLSLADDRTPQSLDGFRAALTLARRDGIAAVALDMWEPCVQSARAHLPGGREHDRVRQILRRQAPA